MSQSSIKPDPIDAAIQRAGFIVDPQLRNAVLRLLEKRLTRGLIIRAKLAILEAKEQCK